MKTKLFRIAASAFDATGDIQTVNFTVMATSRADAHNQATVKIQRSAPRHNLHDPQIFKINGRYA